MFGVRMTPGRDLAIHGRAFFTSGYFPAGALPAAAALAALSFFLASWWPIAQPAVAPATAVVAGDVTVHSAHHRAFGAALRLHG